LDAVYLVKPGDDNEELRFSLRSLAKNMPYVDRVFVAGYTPSWVRNVESIALEPLDDKFDNQFQSLRAACADERISDDFVLMNDDQFALVEMDFLPAWHLGGLRLLIRRLAKRGQTAKGDRWFYGLQQTAKQMRAWGHPNPNAYEAHMPLLFNRHTLAARMDTVTHRPFLWGAAYDAVGTTRGVLGDNVKVGELGARELLACMTSGLPFISTEDEAFAFGKVGEFIRTVFPDPCIYEEAL
jgi:hypothetical protein